MVEYQVGFVEAASVKVVINCEAKVKAMDKVNCAVYRFTIELNLRAQFCPSMQTNGRRPSVFNGQTMNAVRSGAGTCSHSTSSTSTDLVKDVKGTGDPEGIIDAVGRRQSAWRWRR